VPSCLNVSKKSKYAFAAGIQDGLRILLLPPTRSKQRLFYSSPFSKFLPRYLHDRIQPKFDKNNKLKNFTINFKSFKNHLLRRQILGNANLDSKIIKNKKIAVANN